MTGHCKTCVHWNNDGSDWEFDDLSVGDCKAIGMREHVQAAAMREAGIEPGSEDAHSARADAIERKALVDAKAFCVDASSYYAALRTFPDFGCVLHKPMTDEGPKEGLAT